MYVTRLLSMYKSNPDALLDPPPRGPNTGYLVILDHEETQPRSGNRIRDLPFPQNKDLTVDFGEEQDFFMFVPVLNQPLSSNRYYVIKRRGKYKGQASTSSKDEGVSTCLCCRFGVEDVKPRPLEPFNDYQQFEVIKKSHGFHAKSVASDGIPPGLLSDTAEWSVDAETPGNYDLREALGSNDLRSLLPEFNFPLSNESTSESVVVGKWYCPFMFVKEEGMKLKEQMKMSMFYDLTLEQRWEKIFSKENGNNGEDDVRVDVVIQTEVAKVRGRDAVWDENKVGDGVLWFKSFEDVGTETSSVGVSLEVVQGMKWEQERVGWNGGNGRQVRVEREEVFGGKDKWKKFNCYMLVESFVLKRMVRRFVVSTDRLVLTYDYWHTHQIRCKWE